MRIACLPILILALCATTCQNSDAISEQENKTFQPKAPVSKTAVENLLPDDPVLADLGDTVSEIGPKNITRSIMQDRNGTLWFASWQGIFKYDGKQYTNVALKEGLGHYPYCVVFEDSHSNMWFGTMRKGLYKFNGKNFTHIIAGNGIKGNSVFCIEEDNAGNVWFGTDAGLTCYTGNRFVNFDVTDGLADNTVYAILQDKKGDLLIATKAAVCKSSLQVLFGVDSNPRFTKMNGPFNDVRTMEEDANGNIWFGTTNGSLSSYDGKTFTYYSAKDGLKNNSVGCLLADSKGNLWCGGDVHYNDGKSFRRVEIKTNQNSNNVFCIFEDNKGKMWFGMSDGITVREGKFLTQRREEIH